MLLSNLLLSNLLLSNLLLSSYLVSNLLLLSNLLLSDLLMLLLYRILYVVWFKSAESYVGIPYPEYAVVIPGALEGYFLKSLIFRGFRFNCNLLSLIERTPCA